MFRSDTWRVPLHITVAVVLALTSLIPVLLSQKASAYGQITERQVKISSSAPSATGVSYYIEFKPATTGTVNSIAVDFCSDSPIINDGCAATVGTDVPNLGASPAVTFNSGAAGNIITGTWAATQLNANRTLVLTNSGAAMTFTSGVAYYFTITGVVNPSDTATFYGRILTYPNASGTNYAGGYGTGQTVGTNVPTDAGGVALSTAAQITVTSKVQERLTFCVYTTGTGNNCTTKSGTAVTLGDDNGVLYPTGPFVDKSAKFSVSTNSTGSAIVRVKGPTLTSGGNTITSIGGTPTSVVGGGTEQFGFCAYESAASTPAMSIQTTYDGASGVPAGECAGTSQTAGTNTTGGQGTGAEFAYDTNTTDGTGSTYGDLLATKPAGDFSTVTMSFIGNISNSTEAGIYTTTLTFIATGTY